MAEHPIYHRNDYEKALYASVEQLYPDVPLGTLVVKRVLEKLLFRIEFGRLEPNWSDDEERYHMDVLRRYGAITWLGTWARTELGREWHYAVSRSRMLDVTEVVTGFWREHMIICNGRLMG